MNEKNHNHKDIKKEKILFSVSSLKWKLFIKFLLIIERIFFQNQIDINIINVGKKEKSIIFKNNKIHQDNNLSLKLKNKIHKINKCHKK